VTDYPGTEASSDDSRQIAEADGSAEREWTEAELAASDRLMAALKERDQARANDKAAQEAQRLAPGGSAMAQARAARHVAQEARSRAEASVTWANIMFRQAETRAAEHEAEAG
jgi:hypothetical protein